MFSLQHFFQRAFKADFRYNFITPLIPPFSRTAINSAVRIIYYNCGVNHFYWPNIFQWMNRLTICGVAYGFKGRPRKEESQDKFHFKIIEQCQVQFNMELLIPFQVCSPRILMRILSFFLLSENNLDKNCFDNLISSLTKLS